MPLGSSEMVQEKRQTITSIEKQKGGRRRVNVFVDGAFAFSLDPLVVEQNGLRVGTELTGSQAAALSEKDEGEKAYQAALLLLRFRKRSKKEMEERLARRGFSRGAVTGTVRRLEEEGLVDDRLFTEFWKENRESFRPRGKRLMALELRKAGVPGETIAEGLGDVDEAAGAYRAAQAKMRLWQGLEYSMFRKKLAGFLARRGYGWEVIRETVQRVWAETAGPDDAGTA
ncbi:MAG: RecX family transcriptional regulator [Chloroflexi bacterium]|nr:RecX family transcriptional regulator [Chloroflexota bacterium]